MNLATIFILVMVGVHVLASFWSMYILDKAGSYHWPRHPEIIISTLNLGVMISVLLVIMVLNYMT